MEEVQNDWTMKGIDFDEREDVKVMQTSENIYLNRKLAEIPQNDDEAYLELHFGDMIQLKALWNNGKELKVVYCRNPLLGLPTARTLGTYAIDDEDAKKKRKLIKDKDIMEDFSESLFEIVPVVTTEVFKCTETEFIEETIPTIMENVEETKSLLEEKRNPTEKKEYLHEEVNSLKDKKNATIQETKHEEDQEMEHFIKFKGGAEDIMNNIKSSYKVSKEKNGTPIKFREPFFLRHVISNRYLTVKSGAFNLLAEEEEAENIKGELPIKDIMDRIERKEEGQKKSRFVKQFSKASNKDLPELKKGLQGVAFNVGLSPLPSKSSEFMFISYFKSESVVQQRKPVYISVVDPSEFAASMCRQVYLTIFESKLFACENRLKVFYIHRGGEQKFQKFLYTPVRIVSSLKGKYLAIQKEDTKYKALFKYPSEIQDKYSDLWVVKHNHQKLRDPLFSLQHLQTGKYLIMKLNDRGKWMEVDDTFHPENPLQFIPIFHDDMELTDFFQINFRLLSEGIQKKPIFINSAAGANEELSFRDSERLLLQCENQTIYYDFTLFHYINEVITKYKGDDSDSAQGLKNVFQLCVNYLQNKEFGYIDLSYSLSPENPYIPERQNQIARCIFVPKLIHAFSQDRDSLKRTDSKISAKLREDIAKELQNLISALVFKNDQNKILMFEAIKSKFKNLEYNNEPQTSKILCKLFKHNPQFLKGSKAQKKITKISTFYIKKYSRLIHKNEEGNLFSSEIRLLRILFSSLHFDSFEAETELLELLQDAIIIIDSIPNETPEYKNLITLYTNCMDESFDMAQISLSLGKMKAELIDILAILWGSKFKDSLRNNDITLAKLEKIITNPWKQTTAIIRLYSTILIQELPPASVLNCHNIYYLESLEEAKRYGMNVNCFLEKSDEKHYNVFENLTTILNIVEKEYQQNKSKEILIILLELFKLIHIIFQRNSLPINFLKTYFIQYSSIVNSLITNGKSSAWIKQKSLIELNSLPRSVQQDIETNNKKPIKFHYLEVLHKIKSQFSQHILEMEGNISLESILFVEYAQFLSEILDLFMQQTIFQLLNRENVKELDYKFFLDFIEGEKRQGMNFILQFWNNFENKDRQKDRKYDSRLNIMNIYEALNHFLCRAVIVVSDCKRYEDSTKILRLIRLIEDNMNYYKHLWKTKLIVPSISDIDPIFTLKEYLETFNTEMPDISSLQPYFINFGLYELIFGKLQLFTQTRDTETKVDKIYDILYHSVKNNKQNKKYLLVNCHNYLLPSCEFEEEQMKVLFEVLKQNKPHKHSLIIKWIINFLLINYHSPSRFDIFILLSSYSNLHNEMKKEIISKIMLPSTTLRDILMIKDRELTEAEKNQLFLAYKKYKTIIKMILNDRIDLFITNNEIVSYNASEVIRAFKGLQEKKCIKKIIEIKIQLDFYAYSNTNQYMKFFENADKDITSKDMSSSALKGYSIALKKIIQILEVPKYYNKIIDLIKKINKILEKMKYQKTYTMSFFKPKTDTKQDWNSFDNAILEEEKSITQMYFKSFTSKENYAIFKEFYRDLFKIISSSYSGLMNVENCKPIYHSIQIFYRTVSKLCDCEISDQNKFASHFPCLDFFDMLLKCVGALNPNAKKMLLPVILYTGAQILEIESKSLITNLKIKIEYSCVGMSQFPIMDELDWALKRKMLQMMMENQKKDKAVDWFDLGVQIERYDLNTLERKILKGTFASANPFLHFLYRLLHTYSNFSTILMQNSERETSFKITCRYLLDILHDCVMNMKRRRSVENDNNLIIKYCLMILSDLLLQDESFGIMLLQSPFFEDAENILRMKYAISINFKEIIKISNICKSILLKFLVFNMKQSSLSSRIVSLAKELDKNCLTDNFKMLYEFCVDRGLQNFYIMDKNFSSSLEDFDSDQGIIFNLSYSTYLFLLSIKAAIPSPPYPESVEFCLKEMTLLKHSSNSFLQEYYSVNTFSLLFEYALNQFWIDKTEVSAEDQIRDCLRFFNKYVGLVEIKLPNGNKEELMFPIAPCSSFLPKEEKIIYEETIKEQTAEERMKDLLLIKEPKLSARMNARHQLHQLLNKPFLSEIIRFHRYSLWVLVCLSIGLNILVATAYTRPSESNRGIGTTSEGLKEYDIPFTIFMYVGLIFCFLVITPYVGIKLIFFMVISADRKIREEQQEDNEEFKVAFSWKQFLGNILGTIKQYFESGYDFELLFFLIFTILWLMGMYAHPMYFSFHLTIIIKNSKVIRNLLKTIINVGPELLLGLIVLLIVIYWFSVWAYSRFKNNYPNSTCESLFKCYIVTLDQNFKNDGGIGAYLDSSSNTAYPKGAQINYERWAFDNIFNLIVVLLIIQIFAGIIINEFDIRTDQADELNEMRKSRCLVCGVSKEILEEGNKHGYKNHVKQKHNLWQYFFFVDFLKHTKNWQLNHKEKDTKSRLFNDDLSWMPFDPNEMI